LLASLRSGEDSVVAIAEVRELDASADEVWNIVSDVDKDPEYWSGLTSIRNIRKEGNLIEREVVVGFIGRKGTQRIELVPKESIQLTMIDGPLKGTREIRLVPLGARRTKIDVSWDIEFSAIPVFAQGFVRSRLEEGTREALDKIAKIVQAGRK
jgi:ribosome-associated toxin RatA of RatAB toxin-antitoxin module